MITLKGIVPLATAGGLIFIDSYFVVAFLGSNILALATGFEVIVFLMQLVKTVLAVALKDIREGGIALLIDLYGVDLLLLPVLLAAIFFLGPGPVGSVLNQLLRGWMVGVAFFGLPYTAYRLAVEMRRSGTLATVLPSGVIAAEFGVILTNATGSASAAHTGIAGIVDFTFRGKGSVLSQEPGVFVALSVVYVSLLVYAALALNTRLVINRARALILASFATGAGAVWVWALARFSLPVLVVFLPPTLSIAGAAWWFGRGR